MGAGALGAPAAAAAAADPLARISIHVTRRDPRRRRRRRRGWSCATAGRARTAGRIGIELRGQSSLRFPKQAWSLELRDRERSGDNRDVPLLGMPADDDWILYAGYNDKTLMRNVVAYDTARRLGRYASRTRFVEVRLNGRYHGVYVLMEKLKLNDERIDLAEPAQLLEWTFSYQARRKGRFFRLPVSEYFLLFEDPEREDLGRAPARAGPAAASARPSARSTATGFRDPATGWRSHIDEAAAVDYVLINELFKNQDAFHASTYLARARGRPLAARAGVGLRHLDGQLRLRPEPRCWRARCSRSAPGPSGSTGTRRSSRRWRRAGAVLRADGLRARLLRDRRAAPRAGSRRPARPGATSRRWPVLGVRVWPNPPAAVRRTTYASEVRALRWWLKRRIAWMDANVARLG